MFDVAKLRKQFPIFSVKHGEKALVYLDNAATTQKPMVVLERLQRYYSYENASIHRGIYPLAYHATLLYETAREKTAKFLNAHTQKEIVFCKSTTEALNMVAQGLRNSIGPGDEILVTAMEHHANYVPWQTLSKQTGASFQVVPVRHDGTVDLKILKMMLNRNTKVFAFTHISNTLGVINPVHEMVDMAHQCGSLTVLDAAQSVAFDQVDVQDIDCDFLAFSGHKTFGPTGIGILYGKSEQLNQLEPYQLGGAMIVEVNQQESTFKQAPHRFEAGTPPIAEAIALATALEFISEINLDQIKVHSQAILEYAKSQLKTVQGMKLEGPSTGTSNIISFQIEDIHPHDVATILGEQGIAVRAGHHCCQPLMHAMGITGTTRASFSIYNDESDVDSLVDALMTVKKIMS
jgi:cysteine desulfurase/selenocysteine lyase